MSSNVYVDITVPQRWFEPPTNGSKKYVRLHPATSQSAPLTTEFPPRERRNNSFTRKEWVGNAKFSAKSQRRVRKLEEYDAYQSAATRSETVG
jgi:hypothetical protein